MKKGKTSGQSLSEYTVKIIDLYRILKHDFKIYSVQKNKLYKLTESQVLLIDVLYRNPGINLHDLSEKMKMAKSNVSVIVERLVRKGIAIRITPEDNRRTVKLSLSPEFSNQYASMKYKGQYWAEILSDATEEELKSVIDGLETCHELIERNKKRKASQERNINSSNEE